MANAQLDTSTVVAFLSRPDSWPVPGPVEVHETHLSWVFRCGDVALKVKKAVTFAGIDLRDPVARRRNCETEVALNRRFAPDVYRGVWPVCHTGNGALALHGPGEPVEWVVAMSRLPDDKFLDRRIAAGAVNHALLRRALAPIVRHLCTAPAAETDPARYVDGLLAAIALVAHDVGVPAAGVPAQRLAALTNALRDRVRQQSAALGRRAAIGRVVEGHGDLRPEHVCLSDPPAVIDGLEFDAALRTLDGLDDIGFLALECELAGAPVVASTVIDAWRTESREDTHAALLHTYQAYRAFRRASVAALRLQELARAPREPAVGAELSGRVERYLRAAEDRAARTAT